MEQNKVRSYILYAIGEIVLVMIGILLALQVNNWNEERLQYQKETELIQSFQQELIASRNRLDAILSFNEETKDMILELEHILINRQPYDPMFDSLFFGATRFSFGDHFSTVALDNLKSYGVEIIKNKDLRKQLINTYELYPYMKEGQDIYTNIILDGGKDIMNTRFEELWDGEKTDDETSGQMKPLNYEALLDDQEYQYFLRSLPNHMFYFVDRPARETRAKVEISLKMIESELATRR